MLDIDKWTRLFKRNQIGRNEPSWTSPIEIPPQAKAALLQSIAEFQLGDGGGPASLIAWNAESYRQSQVGLSQVIDRWFAEEKEHSRLLGGLLQRFQRSPIASHWSFSLFCWLRRILGVRFELQILTVTELSSTAYYQLLKDYGRDPCLIEVCALILRDEALHVAFQNDRLLSAGAPFGPIWKLQFRLAGWIAASVLWTSHGRCLKQLGVTTTRFFQTADNQFRTFLERLQRRKDRSCSQPQTGA